jgi:hypothetical protein
MAFSAAGPISPRAFAAALRTFSSLSLRASIRAGTVSSDYLTYLNKKNRIKDIQQLTKKRKTWQPLRFKEQ